MSSLWYMLVGFTLGVYLGVTSPSCNKQKADDRPAAACPREACDCCKECCDLPVETLRLVPVEADKTNRCPNPCLKHLHNSGDGRTCCACGCEQGHKCICPERIK